MTKARADALRRNAANPDWGYRLIENESWAKKSEAGSSDLYRGQLVGAGGLSIEDD